MDIQPSRSLTYASTEKQCAFTVASVHSRMAMNDGNDEEELMTIFKVSHVSSDNNDSNNKSDTKNLDMTTTIDFHPKFGIIEPEASQAVTITRLSESVSSCKLQIECLALPRVNLPRVKELWADALTGNQLTIDTLDVKHTHADIFTGSSPVCQLQPETTTTPPKNDLLIPNFVPMKYDDGSKEIDSVYEGSVDTEKCEYSDEEVDDMGDSDFSENLDRGDDQLLINYEEGQNRDDDDDDSNSKSNYDNSDDYKCREQVGVDRRNDEGPERDGVPISIERVEDIIPNDIEQDKYSDKGIEKESAENNKDEKDEGTVEEYTDEYVEGKDVMRRDHSLRINTTILSDDPLQQENQHDQFLEELQQIDTDIESKYRVNGDALSPRVIQFQRQQDLLQLWAEDFELSQSEAKIPSSPSRKNMQLNLPSAVTTPKSPAATTTSHTDSSRIELTEDMRRQFYGSPPVSPTTKNRWASRGVSIDLNEDQDEGDTKAVNHIDISPIKSTTNSPSLSTLNASFNHTIDESCHEEQQQHVHMRKRHPKETKTQYTLRSSIHKVDWENIDVDNNDDRSHILKVQHVDSEGVESTFGKSYVSYDTAHLSYNDLYKNDHSPVPNRVANKKSKVKHKSQSQIFTHKYSDYVNLNDTKTDFEVRLIPDGDILFIESVGSAKSIMKIVLEISNQLNKDESLNVVKSIIMQNNKGPVSLPLFLSGIADLERNNHSIVEFLEEFIICNTSLVRVTKHFNLFKNLINLDLSHNEITEIVDQLKLPKLKFLDLSFNRLKSLDFLQQLADLQELTVTNNCITSIHQSIHMLVPLSYSIRKIDMSQNSVCEELNYCSEMISVLSELEYFDGHNILNIFSGHIRSHSKNGVDSMEFADINQAFANNSNPWSDLDDRTSFECRLRRALHHKYRGMNEKDIDVIIQERSPLKDQKTDLEDYLHAALDSKPLDMSQVLVPNKKPTEEVASYLKSTSISKGKRQSFLVDSRSWSPFKELWTSQDDQSISFNRSVSPGYMKGTQSAKTKRQSFISREAMDALKTRLDQTPRSKPLSAGTIAYMNYTRSAKQKRASFIEINKERAASAPSRMRQSNMTTPSYMNKTKSNLTKRKSYLFGSSDSIDFLSPITSSKSPTRRKKSFVEVNIEQCSNSSKIRAMKRHEDGRKKMKNFRLDEKVEVMFEGREKLYPGKIARTHLDGHFDIKYDDGDEEFNVPAKYIYKLPSICRGSSGYNSPKERFSSPVGQRVQSDSSPVRKSTTDVNVYNRLMNSPTASSRPKRLSYISPTRGNQNTSRFGGNGYIDDNNGDSVYSQRTLSPTQNTPLSTDNDSEKLRDRLLQSAVKLYGTDLNRFFRDVDKDHNGFVDMDELRSEIKKLLPAIREKKVNFLLKTAREQSSNSDGLDPDEFENFIDYENCLHRSNTYIPPSFTPFANKLRKYGYSPLKIEGNLNHKPFFPSDASNSNRIVENMEDNVRERNGRSTLQTLFPEEPSNLSMLLAMSYDENDAKLALQRTGDDLDKAIVLLLDTPKVFLKQDINQQVEKRDTPQKLKKIEHRPSVCSPKPAMLATPRQ